MKQNLLRVGCATLSLSMAAGLLASCSVLPQPSAPASRPAQQEQDAPKNYDAASLKDGKLRILYSYNAPGGNTILCGDTVLRQSPITETSYLLTDCITGETNYYFCQWSDNSTASGRRCGLRRPPPARRSPPDRGRAARCRRRTRRERRWTDRPLPPARR